MTDRKRVFLLDGPAMYYRAFFAFIRNPLINSKGENTSAAFGFISALLKILKDENPDYIAVAFDTDKPTFRHKLYDEYKSTRAKMPEELVESLPRIDEAVTAFRIPSFRIDGVEADDIIGTIAKRCAAAGHDVYCVTADKDYFQLVDDRIRIYNPTKPNVDVEILDRDGVIGKFGVAPEQVIDKLALMGDSSDNVPGVPGIGQKTAEKLLAEFGSLEAILDNADSISAKGVRTKISENVDKAKLSQELVTIDINVELDIDVEDLKRQEIDYDAAKKLFFELEFRRLIRELDPDADETDDQAKATESAATDQAYHLVPNLKDLKALVAKLRQSDWVAVDTETTGLDFMTADLVGVSLCNRDGTAYYVPLAHDEADKNIDPKKALAELAKLLTDPSVPKIGQNIKYDLHVLRRAGCDIIPIGFDTMLASYVLDPSSRQHALDIQVLKHFDYKMQPITDLIGSGKKQLSFAAVPVDQATYYAAEDADFTFRLKSVHEPRLKEREVETLFTDIELPLVPVLADMEAAGVRLDREFLDDLSAEMATKIGDLERQIYDIAGGEFNINSTQQLSHILFEKLGLPTKGKTAKKTGYSTDQSVLEELAHIHEFPQLILDYRQLTKLKSTYVDALPTMLNAETGRVHSSFNQTIAATGRLSSADPNLQNIPIRTEEGRQIRKAFIPRSDDYVLLAADYSQIELRILAHYAEDPALIEAFTNNEDIHRRTASEVFEVDLDDVTDDQRRSAKTANFAIIYGVSAFGLAQQSTLSQDEAKQFIEKYFERYPGINAYMERTKEFAREHGYVTTMFNRRRYLPEIKAKNYNIRQFAERTAINTPIQGTAADIIKLAMLDIHKRMDGMQSQMILQVHDELVFDVHESEVEKVTKIVKAGMEGAAKLQVPLVAEIGTGPNWLEAK